VAGAPLSRRVRVRILVGDSSPVRLEEVGGGWWRHGRVMRRRGHRLGHDQTAEGHMVASL
jgi:hypothetical protein